MDLLVMLLLRVDVAAAAKLADAGVRINIAAAYLAYAFVGL